MLINLKPLVHWSQYQQIGSELNRRMAACFGLLRMKTVVLIATVCLIFVQSDVCAENSPLFAMDLEQLMDMHVTTVSKRKQSLYDVSAAAYIITQDDIRRSGATSLPEILDVVPGINVAKINSSLWAITSRGMRSHYSDKVLVMVDSRSVYNPFFGGVFWEALLPPLNEVERIEVIRGPGASTWGSNAVNGVINIITYDSELTQGSAISLGAGNEEKGFIRAREGFRRGALTGRVNAEYRNVDEAYIPSTGKGANDQFITRQLSSRLDWKPDIGNWLSMDFGYFETELHGTYHLDPVVANFDSLPSHYGASGGWVMSTWLHQLSDGESMQLKAYIDHESRTEQPYQENRITTDLDFQYDYPQYLEHRFTWGVGIRNIVERLEGTNIISFFDNSLYYQKYTAFLQDEYSASETITITMGMKYEYNEYAPPELQPTIRVGCNCFDDIFVWAALSRAARAPGGAEQVVDWRFGAPPELKKLAENMVPGSSRNLYVEALGSRDYASEIANAIEVGARAFAYESLALDLAFYYTKYDKLRSVRIIGFEQNDPIEGFNSAQITFSNKSEGVSKGAEVLLKYEVSEGWRLQGGYAYTHLDAEDNASVGSDYYTLVSYITPRNTYTLISQANFGSQWELDLKYKYISDTFDQGLFGYELDSYGDLSARLTYRLSTSAALSLVGKHLADPRHPQIVDSYLGSVLTEIERSVHIQVDIK